MASKGPVDSLLEEKWFWSDQSWQLLSSVCLPLWGQLGGCPRLSKLVRIVPSWYHFHKDYHKHNHQHSYQYLGGLFDVSDQAESNQETAFRWVLSVQHNIEFSVSHSVQRNFKFSVQGNFVVTSILISLIFCILSTCLNDYYIVNWKSQKLKIIAGMPWPESTSRERSSTPLDSRPRLRKYLQKIPSMPPNEVNIMSNIKRFWTSPLLSLLQ